MFSHFVHEQGDKCSLTQPSRPASPAHNGAQPAKTYGSDNRFMSKDQGALEVFVPTRDSERWIGAFAREWRRIGMLPLYVVDSRTRDKTRTVLHDLGMRQIEVSPEHDRVEDIVWRVGQRASTNWLLRLDDDEFPSKTMLDWIRQRSATLPGDAVGFSRRWCLHHASRLFYAAPPDFFWLRESPDQLDPQIRLFRPALVEWTSNIHSPGFVAKNISFADPGAYFCHFDWIIRTREERKAKMKRYDVQQSGAGSGAARFYLPEDRAVDDLQLHPFETREFNKLASAISRDISWYRIINRMCHSITSRVASSRLHSGGS
jgi:hypothetical protein